MNDYFFIDEEFDVKVCRCDMVVIRFENKIIKSVFSYKVYFCFKGIIQMYIKQECFCLDGLLI